MRLFKCETIASRDGAGQWLCYFRDKRKDDAWEHKTHCVFEKPAHFASRGGFFCCTTEDVKKWENLSLILILKTSLT